MKFHGLGIPYCPLKNKKFYVYISCFLTIIHANLERRLQCTKSILNKWRNLVATLWCTPIERKNPLLWDLFQCYSTEHLPQFLQAQLNKHSRFQMQRSKTNSVTVKVKKTCLIRKEKLFPILKRSLLKKDWPNKERYRILGQVNCMAGMKENRWMPRRQQRDLLGWRKLRPES